MCGFFKNDHGFSFGFPDGMKINFRGRTVLMAKDSLNRSDVDVGMIKDGSAQVPDGMEPEIFYSGLLT